ncbi:hypothetical protein ITK70_001558, partial [Campylobacter lari]|nr:hypothetical protein [Campylobacter lari]
DIIVDCKDDFFSFEELYSILNNLDDLNLEKINFNSQINFMLNNYIDTNSLDYNFVSKFYYKYSRGKFEVISMNYFLKSISEYFYNKSDFRFFEIFSLMSSTLEPCYESSIGRKKFVDLFNKGLINWSKNYKEFNNIKIAICVTGALRGDYKLGLNYIYNNIAKPLNADLFLFTWDKFKIWPGLCGGGKWIERLFSKEILNLSPQEIRYTSKLRELFPNVFEKLRKEVDLELDLCFLQNMFNCIVLDNQIRFDKKYWDKKFHSSFKEAYGLYRVSNAIEEYEIKNSIKYDFIIRIRPDVVLDDVIYMDDLLDLKFNQIVGLPGPELFYGRRDCMLSILKNSFNNYYDIYTCMDSFNIFQNWALIHGIECLPWKTIPCITPDKSVVLKGIRLPDIRKELSQDNIILNEKKFDLCSLRLINNFLLNLHKEFGFKECKSNIKNEGYAKSIIMNHLSFKIGKAMVNKSNIFEYFLLPYVLYKIVKQHNREKMKEDLSLKPLSLKSYPDYKEALKIKNYFSYKLGQALINAHKNWYKGGYIKFW